MLVATMGITAWPSMPLFTITPVPVPRILVGIEFRRPCPYGGIAGENEEVEQEKTECRMPTSDAEQRETQPGQTASTPHTDMTMRRGTCELMYDASTVPERHHLCITAVKPGFPAMSYPRDTRMMGISVRMPT